MSPTPTSTSTQGSSPPPGYIGQELDVQWDGRVVRILDPKTGPLLRAHLRKAPGYGRGDHGAGTQSASHRSTPAGVSPRRSPTTASNVLRASPSG